MKEEIKKLIEQAKRIKESKDSLIKELEHLDNDALIKKAEIIANKWSFK